MKRTRKGREIFFKGLFSISSLASTLTILLITIFLLTRSFGIFQKPVVENGMALYVHPSNPIRSLNAEEINAIFDHEITDWASLGERGEGPIQTVNIDEIIAYSEAEGETIEGEDQLPRIIAQYMSDHPLVLAYLPTQYVPDKGASMVQTGMIAPSEVFLSKRWMPTASPAPLWGILPLLLGTFWVTLGAILLAVPLGLGVAIFLAELATPWMRKIVTPAIELLAGIPSVVYGFWGLAVLVPWIQKAFSLPVGETALAGSFILALMSLPTIIGVAQDALRNTPRSLKEASMALGATHWQTLRKVVLPYAKSGISAAVILGLGRAMGETMAVLMVTGNAAVMPTGMFESVRTIPATIAAELGEVPEGSAHYNALFLLGGILFLFSLLMSIGAEWVSHKQKRVVS